MYFGFDPSNPKASRVLEKPVECACACALGIVHGLAQLQPQARVLSRQRSATSTASVPSKTGTPGVRLGLHGGMAVLGMLHDGGPMLASGETVRVAHSLQALAGPNTVLVSGGATLEASASRFAMERVEGQNVKVEKASIPVFRCTPPGTCVRAALRAYCRPCYVVRDALVFT